MLQSLDHSNMLCGGSGIRTTHHVVIVKCERLPRSFFSTNKGKQLLPSCPVVITQLPSSRYPVTQESLPSYPADVTQLQQQTEQSGRAYPASLTDVL